VHFSTVFKAFPFVLWPHYFVSIN